MELSISEIDKERVICLGPETALTAHIRFCEDVGQTTTTLHPDEYVLYTLTEPHALHDISTAMLVDDATMERLLEINLLHYTKDSELIVRLCVKHGLIDDLAKHIATQCDFDYNRVPVELLLTQFYTDCRGQTPLMYFCKTIDFTKEWAIDKGKANIIVELLKHPEISRPDHINCNSETALICLCTNIVGISGTECYSVENVLNLFLEIPNININQVSSGNESAVRILLETGESYYHALKLAKHGGDIFTTNSFGRTLLHQFIVNQLELDEVIQLYGKKLNLPDFNGRTPLMLVCAKNYSYANIQKFFFRDDLTPEDIGLDAVDHYGNTALIYSCMSCSMDNLATYIVTTYPNACNREHKNARGLSVYDYADKHYLKNTLCALQKMNGS